MIEYHCNNGEIYFAFGDCDDCRAKNRKVVQFDTSGDEYGRLSLCLSCMRKITNVADRTPIDAGGDQ